MLESAFVKLGPFGSVVVADVTCEKVGGREAPIIHQELLEAAEQSRWRIVVDLSVVTLLSSMGLGGLVTLNKQCREHGGALVICGLTPEIAGLLKLTRLDKMLQIMPERIGAVGAIGAVS